MGKTKKVKPAAYGKSNQSSTSIGTFDPKQSRSKKLNTLEDAFGGDEDEFHKNRDLISFDEGKNNLKDLEDISDEDEIYALNLPTNDSDAEDEEEDLDEEDYEEDEEEEEYSNLPTAKPTASEPLGRFAKAPNPSQDIISDGSDSDTSQKSKGGEDSESEEETWASNSYHASRRAPGEADSSDEEALELEVEEARRLQKKSRGLMIGDDFGLGSLEEQGVEEIREKERKRGRLEDEDSGKAIVLNSGKGKKETGEEIVGGVGGGGKKWESEEEAIAYLLKNSPETLALLDDFTDSAEKLKGVEKNLIIVRRGDEDGKEHPALAIMELEHQALSTYLPTLAFYFSLLLSPNPSSELKDKVLNRLSTLRSALATMEELDLTSAQVGDSEDEEDDEDSEDDEFDDSMMGEEEEDEGILASDLWDQGGGSPSESDSDSDDEEDSDEEEELNSDEEAELAKYQTGSDSMMKELDYDSEEEEAETDSMLFGLSDEELEELIKDMKGDDDAEMLIQKVKEIQRIKKGLGSEEVEVKKSKKGKKGEISEEKSTKKKEKKSKSKSPQDILASIPSLAPSTSRPTISLPSSKKSKKSSSSSSSKTNDDYLEPTLLSLTDSTDKASKRHTLRFHVSQVHQKSLKRESGGSQRIGGDEDLPRRSKEASRREVLKRQEHGSTKGESSRLDEEDYNENDRRDAGIVKGSRKERKVEVEVDGEDYYNLIASGKDEGRKAKKAKYDGERSAEKAELDAMGDESAAGPRGATSKMLKNKGLIPKRAKINRNSRVKKREQYEKAKKKVASMKSVYKGGQATLGHQEYSGEKSGIGSAKVVKSVRLGGK